MYTHSVYINYYHMASPLLVLNVNANDGWVSSTVFIAYHGMWWPLSVCINIVVADKGTALYKHRYMGAVDCWSTMCSHLIARQTIPTSQSYSSHPERLIQQKSQPSNRDS